MKKKDNEIIIGDVTIEIDENNYFDFSWFNWLNQFQLGQNCSLDGNIIPAELKMDLYKDSGFFFGMMLGCIGFIGKPAFLDGHILVVGFPGSGKTLAIVIPTMFTWRGIQIIIDVKGGLFNYWEKFNRHTGKKIKVFRPGAPRGSSCRYDPFAFLRHDGANNLAGNARDLALALIPLIPSKKETIWEETAQNFLTGAFIYYFYLGYSFNETMIEIQELSITEIIKKIMDDKNLIARISMSKLSGVDEKVIKYIGMDIVKLATLVIDSAIFNAFSPDDECDLLDWLELNTAIEPFDVILQFPETKFESWKPMILLMINQLIKALEQRSERTYCKESDLPPVLIMLDEFPRLGKISAIQNGLATLRSRGVTFALFV